MLASLLCNHLMFPYYVSTDALSVPLSATASTR